MPSTDNITLHHLPINQLADFARTSANRQQLAGFLSTCHRSTRLMVRRAIAKAAQANQLRGPL